jgi:hypothetical protein
VADSAYKNASASQRTGGMSRFSCLNAVAHLRLLFSSCAYDARERERKVLDKLGTEVMLFTYQLNELSREVARCEEQKAEHVAHRRRAEAEAAVREKHKLLLQAKRTRERLEFTSNILDKIKNTTVIKETMETLHEAQKVFKSIDAPKLYEKFDRLSDSYSVFSDQITDANSLFTSRMSEPLQSSADDQELLAELEAMTADISSAPVAAAQQAQQAQQQFEPPPGVSIARAYASKVHASAASLQHKLV